MGCAKTRKHEAGANVLCLQNLCYCRGSENTLQVQDLLLLPLPGYFKYSKEVRILANGLE